MKRIKESTAFLVDDKNMINNIRKRIVMAHIRKLHFRNCQFIC